MKKFLLCPPTYYDIRYEINPWMNTDNPIDKVKALEQYETLKYAYDALNVSYSELTPHDNLPDQIFTTDTGHIEKNFFNETTHELTLGVSYQSNSVAVCPATIEAGSASIPRAYASGI